jgi:hypothetical protein
MENIDSKDEFALRKDKTDNIFIQDLKERRNVKR